MSDAIIVREWTATAFHSKVLEFEMQGYTTRMETYRVAEEVHPETGEITHLRTIEMFRTCADGR